ncbi:MAG TPA: TadE family protein [Sphingomicrobium sp.]|nr:TadE family protein [Sphingomicrobium sp.]
MTRSLFNCERGNSFVELAFILPVLVMLLIGMVDMSRAASAKLQVVQVAQRTIERVQRDNFQYSQLSSLQADAVAAGGSGTSATAAAWLECGTSTNRLSYTSNCAANQAYARFVEVSVTRSFTPVFQTDWFPGATANGTVPLQGRAVVRVQ